MEFVEIEWDSKRYQEAVALRDRILRKPLGLAFTSEQLAAEASQFHFGLVDQNQVVASLCILIRSDRVVKLRQMVVDNRYQRKGTGRQLVQHAEAWAIKRGYRQIELHSRDAAIGFYDALGYQVVGEPFFEVGLEHRKMVKTLG